jgi:hypothetical protein
MITDIETNIEYSCTKWFDGKGIEFCGKTKDLKEENVRSINLITMDSLCCGYSS